MLFRSVLAAVPAPQPPLVTHVGFPPLGQLRKSGRVALSKTKTGTTLDLARRLECPAGATLCTAAIKLTRRQGGRTVKVAAATIRSPGGGAAALRLKLDKAALRRLPRGQRVSLKVRVVLRRGTATPGVSSFAIAVRRS